MWLSRRDRTEMRSESIAELGTVTLGGTPAGVYLSGERRELPVLGPGGYHWSPCSGQEVLVLKTGAEGELPCVAGVREQGELVLAPGEVLIITGDGTAALRLGLDGAVELTGTVRVNGMTLEEICQAAMTPLPPPDTDVTPPSPPDTEVTPPSPPDTDVETGEGG